MGRLHRKGKSKHKKQPLLGSINNDQQPIEFQSDSVADSPKPGVIFILENASLETGIVRKKKKILSSEEHRSFLLKQGKNPGDYCPENLFEALRGILDSQVNRAGMIEAVYVKTNSGVVFEIKPHTRIPRSCKRFFGLMVELLEKSCVRGDSGDFLFRVLKEPLMRHIPENALIIGLSYSSDKVVDIEDYVSSYEDDSTYVFVVGAMELGKVSNDSMTDYISVSNLPLVSKTCVGLICEALEQKWKLGKYSLA